MNAEDFQSLYMLLRGSKSAFAVLDARTLFIEGQHIAVLERIEEARESYSQSRSRLMKLPPEKQVDAKAKDADRQIKRIERKQEKVKDILKAFDDMLPKIKKLAEREKSTSKTVDGAAAESNPDASSPSESQLADLEKGFYDRPTTRGDLSSIFISRFNQIDGDDLLGWVGKHFGFRPVDSEDDIYADAIYFIKIEDECFLVQTPDANELGDGVPLVSVNENVPMKTYTKEAFVRLGTRRRMVLLTTEFQQS